MQSRCEAGTLWEEGCGDTAASAAPQQPVHPQQPITQASESEGGAPGDVLGRGLGLGGRFGWRGPIRGRGVLGGNRMGGGGRGAMGVKMVRLKLVSVRPVAVTGMGLGCDRRELNGDQEDRRPNHPQNCSGRSHAQLLPYGPSQGNNG